MAYTENVDRAVTRNNTHGTIISNAWRAHICKHTSYRVLSELLAIPVKFSSWALALALFFVVSPRAEAQAAIYHTQLWALSPSDATRVDTTGSAPGGELVQTSDGTFYAVAAAGGANNTGAILAFKKGDTQPTPIYSFTAASGPEGGPQAQTNGDGMEPTAGLALGNDGFLYGTTSAGGLFGQGTVFRISTAGVLTSLHTFTAQDANGLSTDGSTPLGKLVQASDGNLYGTTVFGGASGEGVVFRISPSGAFSVVYAFPGVDGNGFNASGTQPSAGLILASDGNLYGVAEHGGANGFGTVFSITLSGQFGVVHTFSAASTATASNLDGGLPTASLMQARDGNLYGTTSAIGAYGNGTIFRLSLQGVFTTLYSFNGILPGANEFDGTNPAGPLVEGPDGTLYGTAAQGGAAGDGAVFGVSPSGVYSLLYSFGSTSVTGAGPSGGLIFGADGNLYGLTVTIPGFTESAGTAGTAYMLVSTSAPSLVNLAATPTSGIIGAVFTLSWTSPSGSLCAFFTPSENSSVGATGSVTVSPGVAGTFADFLTCGTPLGDANTYVLLTVLTPMPTATLTVSPTSITLGSSATLSWTSTGDADCTGNFSGTVILAQNASQEVTPTNTGVNNYILTCTNAAGITTASASLAVTAAAKPTVTIAVSPTSIAATSGTATLTWSSTGAPNCAASGAWSGSQPTSSMMPITNLPAGQYTYTLSCTGPGGSASASTSLSVNAASGGGGGALSWWMIVGLSALAFLRFAMTRNSRTLQ